ncbi:hypothetical protein [Mesorhizobium sp.]|uniref:hypothetical protein n=1 Tax=Mesorhizobium sp. TaxID=1871066 RepID=UPI000FE79BC5|nr:hypothetical protein [Mesorhizobium sp.]RWE37435.1 MAG: hypothetical protein EOS77_02325 [Mesorhizobium sp.]
MNMAGSLLPSEGNDTLHPVNFAGGVLQVSRFMERETYVLNWTAPNASPIKIAAHPNGYSCKELAERMAAGNPTRAEAQRAYIVACGGYAIPAEAFTKVLQGADYIHDDNFWIRPREMILRYKLAARAVRRHEKPYQHLEEARAAMAAALGYTWVYGYLGEFCNLHERDFPNMIRVRPNRDGLYQHHGYMTPVDRATHKAMMQRERARALYLSRTLCLSPVDRFLNGFHICFKDGEKAAFVDGRLLRFATEGFLSKAVENRAADRTTARDYLLARVADQPEFYWQEMMYFDIAKGLELAA